MQDLTFQQAQISTELDDLVAHRQHLETLEYTPTVETQHTAIEEQITFLRGLAKELQHG